MLSDQEILMLAVLLQTERYGYEIDKVLSTTPIGLQAGVARSSVYAVLTRLYRKRLADCREVPQSGRPPRKLYSITEAGRLELQGSIARELSSEERILARFEIVLYAWPVLSGEERSGLMKSYIYKLREREVHFSRALEESINLAAAASYERSLYLVTAELDWLKRFAERTGIEMPD